MGENGVLVDKTGKSKKIPKAITHFTDFSMEEHARQIADMVEAVKNHGEPFVNGIEGRKALEIVLSIYHSAKKTMTSVEKL